MKDEGKLIDKFEKKINALIEPSEYGYTIKNNKGLLKLLKEFEKKFPEGLIYDKPVSYWIKDLSWYPKVDKLINRASQIDWDNSGEKDWGYIKKLYDLFSIRKLEELEANDYLEEWYNILIHRWNIAIDEEDERTFRNDTGRRISWRMCELYKRFPKYKILIPTDGGEKDPCSVWNELRSSVEKLTPKKIRDIEFIESTPISLEERQEYYENLRRGDPMK